MKKLFFIFLALFSMFFSTIANGVANNNRGSKNDVTLDIESVETMQELLPQIIQEICDGNFVVLKVVNQLAVNQEQFTILRNFGEILMAYKANILLLWQDNFVYPMQDDIMLSHYEWWRWNKLNLGVNQGNGAKWQVESVELYLFVNAEQPETIFEIIETPYEDPFYLEKIEDKLEFQVFPRPRDSYNYLAYPGYPEWANFHTYAEMIAACQIPENILETMSTQAILQALWEYPLLMDVLAGSNYQYQVDIIRLFRTNSYKELINRTDAGMALLYRLSMLNPLINRPPWELFVFQLLTAQPEFLSQLSNHAKKQLISVTFYNDSLLAEDRPFYPFRVTVWFLMGKTLANADYAPFIEQMNENEKLKLFVEWQLYNYSETINDAIPQIIIEYAEKYLEDVDCETANIGVMEMFETNEILIFLNPVKDHLFFSTEKQFEIMDMQGRILLKSEKAMQSVNVSHLKAGIYVIKFEDGSVEKFVKE